MSYLELVAKRIRNPERVPPYLLEAIRERTTEPVQQWIVDMKTDIAAGRPRVVTNATLPSWLDGPSDGAILRIDWDHHHVIRGDMAGESLTVSPDDRFDTVEFTCFGTSCVSRVKVTVDFETVEGETVTETSYFATTERDSHAKIPFSISGPESQSASVSLTVSYFPDGDRRQSALSQVGKFKPPKELWLTPPIPRPESADGPPIFFVSVDAFRYDYLDEFEPLVDALGEEAFVPTEPRTQGEWRCSDKD
jgi:hypothetical protein